MQKANRKIVKFLQKNNLTIAFAESVTCGLAAHQLSAVKGTSEVLKGSIVCYDEKVKSNLLKISQRLIDKHTAESQQVTDAMAKSLKNLIAADIYAAVTGLASDGGSESKKKPVGTIFFSVIKENRTFKMKKRFYGSPLEIKIKACNALYEFIVSAISKIL
jgi:nicotinamide-nucleotide amidase